MKQDRRHIRVFLQEHLRSWEAMLHRPRFVVTIPDVWCEMSLGELMKLRTEIDDAIDFLNEQRKYA